MESMKENTSQLSAALLPCPFCGEEAKIIRNDSYGMCQVLCNCETEPSVILPKDQLRKAIGLWNTRMVDGHRLTFHWERQGVIAPKPAWVVCHDGYMYGPCERWQDVETIIRNEWKADSCLVG